MDLRLSQRPNVVWHVAAPILALVFSRRFEKAPLQRPHCLYVPRQVLRAASSMCF